MNKLGLASVVIVGVFASCIGFPVTYADEMYQCKGPGKFDTPVWQDVPCKAGEEVEHRKLHDYSKEDASKVGHGQFTAAQASEFIRFRKVAVGMSKQDVLKSWGEPGKTNITLSETGKSEQLVYDQYKDTPVINMDEKGIVSSINYSTAKEPATKPGKSLGTVRTSGFGQYNSL